MEYPPGSDVILIRYGDIGTKSAGVQRAMEDTLIEQLHNALTRAGVCGTIEREWTRPIIHTDASAIETATKAATAVFGVVSASPATQVPPERQAIVEQITDTAHSCLSGESFAIRARRSYKEHPFTSRDIEFAAGDAVIDSIGASRELQVDLDDPDDTIYVEIRQSTAYVFVDRVDGPGGLPVGTQAPLVALISGGIDSPVAAYRVMRRGSPIIPVYIDLGDFGGPDHQARALESIATVQSYDTVDRFPTYVVPGGDVAADLIANIGRGRMVVWRRFMLQVAEAIAREHDAVGIVTGESLGQKSSQTASNLAATTAGVTLPVHRPLLDLDKSEITQEARLIGSYQSALVDAGCPSIVPDTVMTRGTIEQIDALEPDDLRERAIDCARNARQIDNESLSGYLLTARESRRLRRA